MTKITPEHLARGAFVYVRQSTADQLLHITRAAVVNTDWPTARVNSAGKRSSSLTTILVVLARASVARVSNACWRRSVRGAPARCSQSRRPA